jgi:hypothetical protein
MVLNLNPVISVAWQRSLDAQAQQKMPTFADFCHNAVMQYASAKNFATVPISRCHAAAVAVCDRIKKIIHCHRRAECPLNLKLHWLSLQSLFPHAHNKKRQLFWKFNQNQLLLNTKNIAGQRFVAARALPLIANLQVAA